MRRSPPNSPRSSAPTSRQGSARLTARHRRAPMGGKASVTALAEGMRAEAEGRCVPRPPGDLALRWPRAQKKGSGPSGARARLPADAHPQGPEATGADERGLRYRQLDTSAPNVRRRGASPQVIIRNCVTRQSHRKSALLSIPNHRHRPLATRGGPAFASAPRPIAPVATAHASDEDPMRTWTLSAYRRPRQSPRCALGPRGMASGRVCVTTRGGRGGSYEAVLVPA